MSIVITDDIERSGITMSISLQENTDNGICLEKCTPKTNMASLLTFRYNSEVKQCMRPSARVSCWSIPATCSESNSKTFRESSTLFLVVNFCKNQKGHKHHDWNDTIHKQ